MKFSVLPQTLLKGIQHVSGVVPIRTTTPILTDLLFELQENNLKITATDLDILVSTTIPVTGAEDGAIALPNRIIGEIIKELGETTSQDEESEQKINFSTEDSYRVKILSDRGTYRIAGDPSEDFPILTLSEDVQNFMLDSSRIQRMIEHTIFAVSSDELRPALMGIFFQICPNELRLVATDGHRLVKIIDQSFSSSLDFEQEGSSQQTGTEDESSGPANSDQPSSINLIVPTKALSLLQKTLSIPDDNQQQDKINVLFDKSHIVFELDNTKIYSRLVESEYPDYNKVIPQFNEKKMVVDRELLYGCLRRVSIFANSQTRQVKFALKTDKMEVMSQDIDTGGEAMEVLPIKYEGEEMDIGYNATYVIETLRHLDTKEVVFLLDTPITAGIVLALKQKEKEDLMTLLMPVRLDEYEEEEESQEGYDPPTEESPTDV